MRRDTRGRSTRKRATTTYRNIVTVFCSENMLFFVYEGKDCDVESMLLTFLGFLNPGSVHNNQIYFFFFLKQLFWLYPNQDDQFIYNSTKAKRVLRTTSQDFNQSADQAVPPRESVWASFSYLAWPVGRVIAIHSLI